VSSARALVLRDGDRERLTDLARRPSVASGLAKRARMVLLAADGMPNAQIAREVGVSRPTVIGWRDRYSRGGIRALEDEPRCGRPPRIDEADVVVATLARDGRPPPHLETSQWSARLLAAELGISFASVARVWRRWGIRPGKVETFRFGTVPELEPRIRDVVGLYLCPPDHALVVSVAEEFQVRLPHRATSARRRLPEWRTRDHRRHGASTLLAALEQARLAALEQARLAAPEQARTGPAGEARQPRHREFIRFLHGVVDAHRGVELHVVADGFRLARNPEVRRWLARPENHRVSVYATPAGCPWLTLVEIFFGILAEQGIRPGTARPNAELSAAISGFTGTNKNGLQPFTWIKNAAGLPG
jgi:transposase